MKQHSILEGTEYKRISKSPGQSWRKEKSNRTGAYILKCAAQRQLSLNFSAWSYKGMACTRFLWKILPATCANSRKQSLVFLLFPWLFCSHSPKAWSAWQVPKAASGDASDTQWGGGSPHQAQVVLLSPSLGQKIVAYPDMQAAFFLLVKHSWAAGFSYHSSMRDTVNSRSITTLKYDNPTWLEMLYFLWRGINNRHFTCN